jgi:hypothetical protein
MVLLLFGFGFVIWTAGFVMGLVAPERFPTCTEEGLNHPSPRHGGGAKLYHAVVLDENCGATSGSLSKVEIREPVPFDLSLPYLPGHDRQAVFISDHAATEIELRWVDSTTLVVTVPRFDATVWRQKFEWSGIRIKYCERNGGCKDG